MNTLEAIVRALAGLFVEDGSLALEIVAVVVLGVRRAMILRTSGTSCPAATCSSPLPI